MAKTVRVACAAIEGKANGDDTNVKAIVMAQEQDRTELG